MTPCSSRRLVAAGTRRRRQTIGPTSSSRTFSWRAGPMLGRSRAVGSFGRDGLAVFSRRGCYRPSAPLASKRPTVPHALQVGAGAALAGGQDPEELLDGLAEVVRQAGREFREMVEAEALPTAGNA